MDIVEVSKQQAAGHQGLRHPWEQARLKAVRRLLKQAHPAGWAQASGSVLDVGSGDIFVADALGQAYPNKRLLSIDIAYTPEIIARFNAQKQSPNLQLYTSLQEAQAADSGPYNTILLLDVIEHVADDKALLTELASAPQVPPGATMLITVPAYQSLFTQHDVFMKHYRRYTRDTLRASVEATGQLEVVESGYFFTSLLLPRWLQYRKEQRGHKPNASGVSTWTGGPTKTSLLTGILATDFAVGRALRSLGLRLPGLSCYALCRKTTA